MLSNDKKLAFPVVPDQELTITKIGSEVLAGEKNWLNMIAIERWIGGVHLTESNIWCWNSYTNKMIRNT